MASARMDDSAFALSFRTQDHPTHEGPIDLFANNQKLTKMLAVS